MSCKSDPQKRSPLIRSTLELLSYILSLLLSSAPDRCLHWRSFSSFSPAWLNPRQSAFHLCCSTKTASQKPPVTSVAEFNRHFQPTSHLTHQKYLTVPSFLLKHAFPSASVTQNAPSAPSTPQAGASQGLQICLPTCHSNPELHRAQCQALSSSVTLNSPTRTSISRLRLSSPLNTGDAQT